MILDYFWVIHFLLECELTSRFCVIKIAYYKIWSICGKSIYTHIVTSKMRIEEYQSSHISDQLRARFGATERNSKLYFLAKLIYEKKKHGTWG